MHLGEGKRFRSERLQDFVVLLDLEPQQALEFFRIDQVDHAQPRSGRFVTVGGTDAALGRANLVLALQHFTLGVQFAVIREDQVSGFADEKVLVNLYPELFHSLDFVHQPDGINHHTVADDAYLVLAQNARRNQVQNVFFFSDVNRVTGIIAALGPHNDIGVLRQDVNDLSFSFVAPLGAD